MPTISTHVLDAAGGGGLAGVAVEVRHADGTLAGAATTGEDGRARPVEQPVPTGTYRIAWATGGSFVQGVEVQVGLAEDRHYHVPLLATAASAVTYLGV